MPIKIIPRYDLNINSMYFFFVKQLLKKLPRSLEQYEVLSSFSPSSQVWIVFAVTASRWPGNSPRLQKWPDPGLWDATYSTSSVLSDP